MDNVKFFNRLLRSVRRKSANTGARVHDPQTEKELSDHLGENLEWLQKIYADCSDVIFHDFFIGDRTRAVLIYIDGLSHMEEIDQHVLAPLQHDFPREHTLPNIRQKIAVTSIKPVKTVADVIGERIVGRFPGKIIGGAYWLFYLYLNGIIVREYGEFVVGALFSNTPLIVVSGSMVLVCAIAVRGGVEIVGRFSDLFLPAFFILFLLIIVPIIPDLRVAHMLPVMGEGIMPSIAGSLVLQIWFSELLTASFLLPFVSDQKKAAKSISYTLLAVILTLVVSNLATLLLLGDLTGSYTYPFLILARYINLAEFFTHLEALFMAIWVLGAFVKICVFYYVTVLGAAQWMNLSDYRPIVFPLGLLLTLFSIWVAPNYQKLTHAISTSVIFATLTMFVIVPGLLLCTAWVKKNGCMYEAIRQALFGGCFCWSLCSTSQAVPLACRQATALRYCPYKR